MAFLPIVDRELRTRSRKASTFWLRGAAAAFGILVAGGMLLMHAMAARGQFLGSVMFPTLSWMIFAYCLLEGARNSADCLSEEKREGTLGLLFLTDLKGYDVVLGKLAAASLNSVYGLLAALPVLALSILLGGVTAGEFWRVALVFANTLWIALVCGILASTFSRQAGGAWAATIGLLVVWLGGPPALLGVINLVLLALKFLGALGAGSPVPLQSGLLTAGQWISFTSPVTPFFSAFATTYGRDVSPFWISLCFTHALAWLGVAVASRFVPRRWQDGPKAAPRTRPWWRPPAPRASDPTVRAAARTRILEGNPVVWLAHRGRARQYGVWALAAGSIVACVMAAFMPVPAGMMMGGWLVVPFEFGLKVWVAFEACRLLGEARKSGALELMLVTPLTSREILQGQWLALRQRFLWPAVTMAAAYAVLVAGSAWSAVLSDRSEAVGMVFLWLTGLNHVAAFATSLIAVVFVGLRLALTLRKPGQSAGLTILLVVLAPSFIFCVPNVAIHLGFILWARANLEGDLRRKATADLTRPPGG